jgi:hypothetical protein
MAQVSRIEIGNLRSSAPAVEKSYPQMHTSAPRIEKGSADLRNAKELLFQTVSIFQAQQACRRDQSAWDETIDT